MKAYMYFWFKPLTFKPSNLVTSAENTTESQPINMKALN